MSLKQSIDKSCGGFSEITTVFDCDKDSPYRLLHSSSIRNKLMRLLPPHFFLLDDSACNLDDFFTLLPIVKTFEWGERNLQISCYLLCKHRLSGVKFFYEMISRWLRPGKRLNISSMFATDFKLSALSDELLTLCEIVISLEKEADLLLVRQQLPIIESEIRMGLTSVYHANRILEIKGLSADEKTALIQERIASLLERRIKSFDYDIFAQMQHFLVTCGEEFKAVRDAAHMSRIIYVFYLFRKTLRAFMEKNPEQRFVFAKACRVSLHLPLGRKNALGIFIGLNFQGDNELFEERHLLGILSSEFPQWRFVADSCFLRSFREERSQLLYLEVEKEGSENFTAAEVLWIRQKLPAAIKDGIEKFTRPLFMPRNEEEVMRNIITLAHQLKFLRDLPQVIIMFDEQAESELSFTIICTRILKADECTIQELFAESNSFLRFVLDRIRQVGFLRRKYPKEATVFRVTCDDNAFLRTDHSVDLFKARQAIAQELQRIIGEFRDYNGGMIAKQLEQFLVLKSLLPELDRNEEHLLENFFHAICPSEMCSLVPVDVLKNFYLLLRNAIQQQSSEGLETYRHTDAICCYFLLRSEDRAIAENLTGEVNNFQSAYSQFLTIEIEQGGVLYLGFAYLEENQESRDEFFNKLEELLAAGVKSVC